MTKKDRGGDRPKMRPLNPEAAPPLFHPGGLTSESAIRSAGGCVAGAAGGFSGSHFLPLPAGWAAPPSPICRKGPEVPPPGPQSLVPSQGPSVCPGSLCQPSRDPADSRELPDQGGGRDLSAKGPHLAQGRGKMLCDPDTHAGPPPRSREKQGRRAN